MSLRHNRVKQKTRISRWQEQFKYLLTRKKTMTVSRFSKSAYEFITGIYSVYVFHVCPPQWRLCDNEFVQYLNLFLRYMQFNDLLFCIKWTSRFLTKTVQLFLGNDLNDFYSDKLRYFLIYILNNSIWKNFFKDTFWSM